jgi:nitroreductase
MFSNAGEGDLPRFILKEVWMSENDPVLKNILTRRSVRQFTGEPVKREDLLALAKAGFAAPSSRDTRHFCFVIVDDGGLVNKLAEGLPYAKMLLTAKHAVIVCSDLSLAHGGSSTDYWVQDSSAAAENILLAAHALGLGACWTAAHPRPERVAFVKQALALPDNVMPLCVIAVGRPDGKVEPRDKFEPSQVRWNNWEKSL